MYQDDFGSVYFDQEYAEELGFERSPWYVWGIPIFREHLAFFKS